MANEVMGTLFGVTPEALMAQREQQLQQRALQFAQLDPMQAAQAGFYTAGSRLGTAAGGLLGAEDPELMRVRQRQQLLQGVDPTSIESLQSAAQQAMGANDFTLAQELAKRIQDMQVKQAGISKDVAAAQASLSGRTPPDVLKAQRIAALNMAIPAYEAAGDTSTAKLLKDERDALLPADKTVSYGEEANRVSVATFGKPFAQLTQEQAKQVDQTLERRGINKAAASRTTVNLPPQEKAEQGKRGEFLVDQYKDISKQAAVATRTLPALESTLNILDKGFDTGFGTETIAAGAKVLASLGVEGAKDFATDAQSFLGAASQAVLTRQLEQKGPQTESDAQRITQTGAQLGNTKEANRFLVSVAKAQFRRDIAQRNFFDSWWKKNKTYDGAEDAWYAGEGGRSLFDYPELRKYRATEPTSSQIPTQRGTAATTIYARNPQTNERIMSTDGGKTWQPAR